MFNRKPKPQEPDHFYELRVTPTQRERLIELCEGKSVGQATKNVLARVLQAAERFEGRPFNWDRAEREAKARGGTLVDYVWDRGGKP